LTNAIKSIKLEVVSEPLKNYKERKRDKEVMVLSELKDIPEGGLVPEEQKILGELGEDYDIKEKNPHTHCVCRDGEIKAEFNPLSCSADRVVERVKGNEISEGPRAS